MVEWVSDVPGAIDGAVIAKPSEMTLSELQKAALAEPLRVKHTGDATSL